MTPELDTRTRDASPIHGLSKDAPPTYMINGQNSTGTEESSAGLWIHHPLMGLRLENATDKLGLECHLEYNGGSTIEGCADIESFSLNRLGIEKPFE